MKGRTLIQRRLHTSFSADDYRAQVMASYDDNYPAMIENQLYNMLDTDNNSNSFDKKEPYTEEEIRKLSFRKVKDILD